MVTSPRTVTRSSQDISDETIQDARFIGNLQPRLTRINVSSTLSAPGDKEDFYRIRLTTAGKVGLNFNDEGVRIQLLSRGGRVIADSDATSGQAKDNFDKLKGTNLSLQRADYVVRVTRSDGELSGDWKRYTFQMRTSFEFKYDYDTLESPPSQNSSVRAKYIPLSTYSTAGTFSMLAGRATSSSIFA